MKYSLYDLLDRKSILQLKIERIPFEDKQIILKKEYAAVNSGIEEYIQEGVSAKDLEEWHLKLYYINGKIWDLEAAIGEKGESRLNLEDIGRAALEIRNYNSQRIGIKNLVVEKTGIGHKEIKMYHASQEL